MQQNRTPTTRGIQQVGESYDATIIGAGPAGLYQLHRLRELGLSARLFDDGADVGGTWFRNRYPGAKLDSESYAYAYSSLPEMQAEWLWQDHFASQQELQRYYRRFAEKFDLYRDIELGTRVTAASWSEEEGIWIVTIDSGRSVQSRYLIAAAGMLSAEYLTQIPGIDDFQGTALHTSRWPAEGLDLTGMRVGVIGTGSTGVHVIESIAGDVDHLYVFQRTPNYCAPLRNRPLDADTQARIANNDFEPLRECHTSPFGFPYGFDSRSVFDVSPEERHDLFEKLWAEGGFKKWLANFYDIMVDPEANEIFAEFVREKIRERVDNPELAELLVPTDYPFGAKRVVLETNYYEQFNRENVDLVDVKSTPIERFSAEGIHTRDGGFYACDVIIFATGFDAITGALRRIDIRGTDSAPLATKWENGPAMYLNVQSAGFPNLFIASSNAFCNYTKCAEVLVDWITECIAHMESSGYTRIEATAEAEADWVDYATAVLADSMMSQASSWFVGSNIPGKKPGVYLYGDSLPNYRARATKVVENEYDGFILS
jgi:cation diffusion facilitator CzcD-associated flavoprotein CzcO